MILTKKHIDILNSYGLNFDGVNRNIPDDFICEIPCSLKRTEVGPHVKFGAFSYMVSGYLCATEVGRYCSIAEDVQIGRQNHPLNWVSTSPHFYIPANQIQPVFPYFKNYLNNNYYQHEATPTKLKYTTIGHDVWIGHGAIVNAGITIGNGAIVAAGSVVTKDVKPYSIVGGNPAKFIRYRISHNLIEPLEETKWWEYSPQQLISFKMHDIENFIFELRNAKLKKREIRSIYLNRFNFNKGVKS